MHTSDAKCLPCGSVAPRAKRPRIVTVKCHCCGTILHCASGISVVKCAVCSVKANVAGDRVPDSAGFGGFLSLTGLQRLVDECYSRMNSLRYRDVEVCRDVFDPVCVYLTNGFQDNAILHASFAPTRRHELVDLKQLSEFYQLILDLPTKKPLYRMLRACDEFLRKSDPPSEELRWLFIIWFNPIIRQSLIHKDTCEDLSPQIRSLSYEIAKRCVGYMSNLPLGPAMNKFLHYLKYMPNEEFQNQVETVNLYITFQLSRLLKKGPSVDRPDQPITRWPVGRREASSNKDNAHSDNLGKVLGASEFKLYEYAKNWRIKTAVSLMGILYLANNKRADSDDGTMLGSSEFYNMMFDFIDYRQDFLSWRQQGKNAIGMVDDRVVFEATEPRFALCEYPFLLSIGIKKMVMDLETKRIMSTEAEQAFLNSLDSSRVFEVTLKIRVRRSHIVEDSLKCIREHKGDLMKPLKVQFVNEPGVDAGGLRKEWFLLLTKSLARPERGLFSMVEESGYSWFAPRVTQRVESNELYYLFGIVIGLAIFNGIILDLRFPSCFYRKLYKESLNFSDYEEIFPETASNLKKMLAYDQAGFSEAFGLTFETTIDKLESGKRGKIEVELCANGSHRRVTGHNKAEFVDLWTQFYLGKSFDRAFEQFSQGFRQVFSQCHSIRLFSASELEKLLCGSRENNCYDFKTLRSVTKYTGGFTDTCQTVEWFWDILQEWDITLKRKLLSFMTGSDRVPPTGICTLTFKINRIGPKDSENLPVAHTCFNEICLWEYSSKAKLKDKLWWAVTQSEGFGFK